MGIDSAAHSGAIKAEGKTVAFLGCGLGCKYLYSNKELRDSIARHGAVVSEFAPFSEPSRSTFPIRNRLISGMSLGIVVVEAGEKSGSLITAKRAYEQGRDVFCIPGDVTNTKQFGTNALLRDGAMPVFSYMDVVSYYPGLFDEADVDTSFKPLGDSDVVVKVKEVKAERKKKEKKEPTAIEEVNEPKASPKPATLPDFASEAARAVFAAIESDGSIADDIAAKCGLAINSVLAALTELEMFGVVTQGSGKRYFAN